MDLIELDIGTWGRLGGGPGVGVIGYSLGYGLDSTESREKDGDCSCEEVSCCRRRKDVRLRTRLVE